jgi:hypothetical protein
MCVQTCARLQRASEFIFHSPYPSLGTALITGRLDKLAHGNLPLPYKALTVQGLQPCALYRADTASNAHVSRWYRTQNGDIWHGSSHARHGLKQPAQLPMRRRVSRSVVLPRIHRYAAGQHASARPIYSYYPLNELHVLPPLLAASWRGAAFAGFACASLCWPCPDACAAWVSVLCLAL